MIATCFHAERLSAAYRQKSAPGPMRNTVGNSTARTSGLPYVIHRESARPYSRQMKASGLLDFCAPPGCSAKKR